MLDPPDPAQTVADLPPTPPHPRLDRGRRHWWMLVACAILVLGLSVSLDRCAAVALEHARA